MKSATSSHQKRLGNLKKNPIEYDTENQGIDASFLDQLFGLKSYVPEKKQPQREQRDTGFIHKEQVIFERKNREVSQHIQELTQEVRGAIKTIKQSNKALISQIADIEKETIQGPPQKSGIYHVRFLESLLSFLKLLQVKVGEAKTWLSAMQTKKQKRGSAFVARAKKRGTQYSLSQELTVTRATQ